MPRSEVIFEEVGERYVAYYRENYTRTNLSVYGTYGDAAFI